MPGRSDTDPFALAEPQAGVVKLTHRTVAIRDAISVSRISIDGAEMPPALRFAFLGRSESGAVGIDTTPSRGTVRALPPAAGAAGQGSLASAPSNVTASSMKPCRSKKNVA